PDGLAPAALRGRAVVDGSTLVGGAARGLFLEVRAGRLDATALDPSGDLAPVASVPSAVRAGFDAVPRAGGGAIVAGVAADDPSRVVAFAIDPSGVVGAPLPTTLPVHPGELAVRLVPLPSGGALLTDVARVHVAWLDDDGRELAAAPWPAADD